MSDWTKTTQAIFDRHERVFQRLAAYDEEATVIPIATGKNPNRGFFLDGTPIIRPLAMFPIPSVPSLIINWAQGIFHGVSFLEKEQWYTPAYVHGCMADGREVYHLKNEMVDYPNWGDIHPNFRTDDMQAWVVNRIYAQRRVYKPITVWGHGDHLQWRELVPYTPAPGIQGLALCDHVVPQDLPRKIYGLGIDKSRSDRAGIYDIYLRQGYAVSLDGSRYYRSLQDRNLAHHFSELHTHNPYDPAKVMADPI